MRRAHLLTAFALLLACAGVQPPSASAQACTVARGFATLRELIIEQFGDVVGRCLEEERFNPANRNAEQRTTGGLFVWRQADNWTAFTDGSRTWINGPEGLHSRPNGGPFFPWEATPAAAPAPRPPAPTGAPNPSPPPPPADPPTRPPAPTASGRLGEPVLLSDQSGAIRFAVAVHAVIDPAAAANRSTAPAGRWVLVEWSLENRGSRSITVPPSYLRLRTKDGAAVEPGSHAGHRGPRLPTGEELGPGELVRGFLAYDVPAGQRLRAATFHTPSVPPIVIADLNG